ncbi:MAG TPA: IS30 family transposase [Thermoleophilaceae bacterium]|nr:IS30 family transposase [Thermoleophilaceae bacterium]
MKKGRKGLSQAQHERIWEVRAEGLGDAALARRLGLSPRAVNKYLNACGGIRPRRPRRRAPGRLTAAEREEISRGIARRDSDRKIGRDLGRSHTTIAREIGRCGGRRRYRAHFADQEAWLRARRPKPGKLERCPALRRVVVERLEQDHSPQQVSGWLRRNHPDNEAMQVSHETIYRSLYVQSRGALKRELTRHLRSHRHKRLARGTSRHGQGRGKIREMVMISERPPEVEDRAVPGHWEGDLLFGSRGNAIATLVERQTRYCQLVALPEGARAEPVRLGLAASITTLPEQLRRSLTWDQGLELAEHRRFSVDSGVEVYFCDPHSPWQRGSNENTNGLLRQYFPKGKSLAKVTQRQLDDVAAKLNGRPRQTLGFMTPAEKFAELLEGPEQSAPER